MNQRQIASFIWGVADLVRDIFECGKYPEVILPLTVLRRLDCVLAPTQAKVLGVQAKYKGKIEDLAPRLRRASGFAFYNTSRVDFDDTINKLDDKDGQPEAELELRDTQSVPLAESVEAFFEREVKPHVPDAWIDIAARDAQDREAGIVGYELNFYRYFYEYRPPQPLEQIGADIQAIEKELVAMPSEVAGA